MIDPVRVMPLHTVRDPDADPHLKEEWLVTNAFGGYASGTVGGAITRRYHGYLVAALANPYGRVMMFNALSERLRLAGGRILYIGTPELTGSPESTLVVTEFRLQGGLPIWRYEQDGLVLEKRLIMPRAQNTVHITYRLLAAKDNVRLGIRPAVHFRSHDAPVDTRHDGEYALTVKEDRYEIAAGAELPPLRLTLHGDGAAFTFDRKWSTVTYRTELNRGYAPNGTLWSPGYFRLDLEPLGSATLVASTEAWDTIHALSPQDALLAETERRRALIGAGGASGQDALGAELILAADQFLIRPVGRIEDTARARASGEEVRTVIAGYHWFTDWGRDTMISLEGLALITGREIEAGWILRTFSQYIKDGLIPNLFPEGEKQGLYHTADATLWFFHAVNRYVERTGDRALLRLILPSLIEIAHCHLEGTHFGIRVDAADGLLSQGELGYQLTWMDAKVGDWVVTPRRGKAVEINALWYNTLRLLTRWMEEESAGPADLFKEAARHARESFNARFWNPKTGYLYDVIDGETGDDDACRPNQVFAISLEYPVLDELHWR